MNQDPLMTVLMRFTQAGEEPQSANEMQSTKQIAQLRVLPAGGARGKV